MAPRGRSDRARIRAAHKESPGGSDAPTMGFPARDCKGWNSLGAPAGRAIVVATPPFLSGPGGRSRRDLRVLPRDAQGCQPLADSNISVRGATLSDKSGLELSDEVPDLPFR